MEHKGIQYSVALIGNRWRWMAHICDGMQTGFAGNRALAILSAIKVINKAAKQQKAAIRGAADALRFRTVQRSLD
jgi:hypothetical protein